MGLSLHFYLLEEQMNLIKIYNLLETETKPLCKTQIQNSLKISKPIVLRELTKFSKLELINVTKDGRKLMITKSKKFKSIKKHILFLESYLK